VPGKIPPFKLRGKLRPSQAEAVRIARSQLDAGERRLHIVAPPGSGKTVLGLYLWAEVIRRPALVLSPNSAIQVQWVDRLDLFETEGSVSELVSTDTLNPAAFTSLTYQAVTLPRRGSDEIDEQAAALWRARLVESDQADDVDQAEEWIRDLKLRNPDYHAERLSFHRREAREAMALGGDALATVHSSVMATLERLRSLEIGMLVLDECHHLLGHWGRVLDGIHEYLGEPVVVGLTATPPDLSGRADEDIARYEAFLGPVDHEVPVPALVRDGYLAPYQDLSYFVRPADDELAYIATADGELTKVVEELCGAGATESNEIKGTQPLDEWLSVTLAEKRLPVAQADDWAGFERRDPALARAARLFLTGRGRELPPGVPPLEPYAHDGDDTDPESMGVLVPVLDRYIRHGLRPSPQPADHKRADHAIGLLRRLGIQITETGAQPCASPVARVLAYTRSKTTALLPILKAEMAARGDSVRAVVVTDYERTSAVAPEVGHLLDEEAGGAVAAFRALLTNEQTDELDPVLVTGSSVLVDDDLSERFRAEALAWLARRGLGIELDYQAEAGFNVLVGHGSDWGPRVYVAMITELFQHGVTRCLVGTRGLLGEGWDASKVNVLVDLTTVTTSMSINQLRGRSMRLDIDDPEKLSSNWDVVCIAPEYRKGLDDYRRFISKHRSLYGVTDDGAIEKGVGHVHAAFTEIRPEGVESAVGVLNGDMILRAAERDHARGLWRIGEPYAATPVRAVETKLTGGGSGGFPPFLGAPEPWRDATLARAIGEAVLGALRDADMVRGHGGVAAGERDGGYVRLFLADADEDEAALFAGSVAEALGPLVRPRYVIPRYVADVTETWVSRLLPNALARYFRRRTKRVAMWHAVPAPLAKKKELAAVYQYHWNRHVSPGEAVYAHRGEGEEIVERARREGLMPLGAVHEKEVML